MSAAPTILLEAAVLPPTSRNCVPIPAKPLIFCLAVGPHITTVGLPPEDHDSLIIAFRFASENEPWVVASVGELMMVPSKPVWTGLPEPLEVQLDDSHDSTEPSERAAAVAPPVPAWFCVRASSMSRLTSLPRFISW